MMTMGGTEMIKPDIRGLEKFTLVDYPGNLACVVFFGHCNFRCPFCHNPCLVLDPESQPRLRFDEFLRFLDSRQGKLDGVVISGGEATLSPVLPEFVAAIKERNFKVKLDTNASNPDVVIKLYEAGLIDALGIDYKASADNYKQITASTDPDIVTKIHELLFFAVRNQIQLDTRTTVHKALHSIEQLEQIYTELATINVPYWVLQQFNPIDTLDEELAKIATYSDLELVKIARRIAPDMVKVRGLTGLYLS